MRVAPIRKSMSEDDDEEKPISLDWRDYVAIAIAALETVLLPLIVVLLVMIGLYVVLR